jgi:hypothetical protein
MSGASALPSISTYAHHAITGEVHDLSTVRTFARLLRRRSGVVRGDTHAPRADRVVERQLPPLKPSRSHDGTPMHGLRISRSSTRNCLLMAKSKLPNAGNDVSRSRTGTHPGTRY